MLYYLRAKKQKAKLAHSAKYHPPAVKIRTNLNTKYNLIHHHTELNNMEEAVCSNTPKTNPLKTESGNNQISCEL